MEKIKVKLYLEHETSRAWLVWDTKTFSHKGRHKRWMPKRMAKRGQIIQDNIYLFEMTEELANEYKFEAYDGDQA